MEQKVHAMYKKILVPLDGSELAEKALSHARELAKAGNSQIILLEVIDTTNIYPVPGVAGPIVGVPMYYEDIAQQEKQYLEKQAEPLRAEGIDTDTVVEEGSPASEVCDFAERTGVDIIVMSTHGRSGINRWVYGSVADRVLRGARVPVLLVRALTKP